MGLRARKLRVVLGGNTIIHNVDFQAAPGQFIGILGPSGCGKSTLLRALSGFRPATEGTVIYDGKDLYENFEELKHSIGFVPQDDVVPMALKVERVLGYSAELRLREFSVEERAGRVNGVLRTLGMTESRRRRVSKLSGGQRKRVSVGMELISRPELIFADEPTSGLDPALERSLTETFKELTTGGRIVVVTTHIMSSLDLLDMVCVLGEGRLCYFGPVKELKKFFGVEDYVQIYARLQEKSAAAWHEAYKKSTLGAEYLT